MNRAAISEIASPVYAPTVNEELLRFFPAPGAKPEAPWCCMEDVLRVCSVTPFSSRVIMGKFHEAFPDQLRTVRAGRETVTLLDQACAGHFLGILDGYGLVDMAIGDAVCAEMGNSVRVFIEKHFGIDRGEVADRGEFQTFSDAVAATHQGLRGFADENGLKVALIDMFDGTSQLARYVHDAR